jgi:hypothetical protein
LTGPLYQLGDYAECVYRQEAQYCLAQVQLKATNLSSPFWRNIEVKTLVNARTNTFNRPVQNYINNTPYSHPLTAYRDVPIAGHVFWHAFVHFIEKFITP